jgi:hypothetical protein
MPVFERTPSPAPTMSQESTGLEYAEYNRTIYEPWLAKMYEPSQPPWFEGLGSQEYSVYNNDYTVHSIKMHRAAIRDKITGLKEFMKGDPTGLNFAQWKRAPQFIREDAALRSFKREADAAVKYNIPHRRDESSFLTLEWITAGDNFENLVLGLIPSSSKQDFGIIRDEKWEQLQDPTAGGKIAVVGMSMGMRLYLEDATVSKHMGLVKYCYQLYATLVRLFLTPSSLSCANLDPSFFSSLALRRRCSYTKASPALPT